MAKAKEYVGESYTDSAGKQWRWDGKKYVRNFGASPMASIKRSWNQKIVPAAQQVGQALTNKGPIEGRGRKTVEPSSPSGGSFQDAMGYEPKGEMKSMFETYFNDLDTGFFSDQIEAGYNSLKDVYGVFNQQQLTEDNQTFTNTPDPETYTTWDSETDKTETGTVGDKAWKADMRSPEEIAREEWESKSSNTPAAKAFEEGTGQQKKDWGDLRWEARKRHKKLFEYNTDKEE